MIRSVTLASLLALVVVTGAGTPALAASDYDVSIDGAVDTLDRTVSTGQGTFTVSAVGRVDPGDPVSVSATVPDGHAYSVAILDSDQQIQDAESSTGSDSFTFETDGLGPGTYAVTLSNGSEMRDVQPLVVSGYAVDTSHADTVSEDESLSVTVELTELDAAADLDSVVVVVGNDDSHTRTEATRQSDGTYTASVPVDSLEPGEYSVYAVAQSPDQALGEQELIGLSDPATVTVEEAESVSGGGGASTDDETATTTTTKTPAETTATNTPAETTDTTSPSDDATTETGSTATATSTPLEPSTAEAAATETTETSTPNRGLVLLLTTLVGLGVARRLRS